MVHLDRARRPGRKVMRRVKKESVEERRRGGKRERERKKKEKIKEREEKTWGRLGGSRLNLLVADRANEAI